MALSPRRKGIAQVAISGVFFGLLGPLGKSLYANGVTAGELLSLRFLLAAILLWPVLWLRHPREWKLPIPMIAKCASLGIGGYALFSSCFFLSLEGLSASLSVLLLYTYPVIVTAAAWALWGERVPRAKWPALPMAMLGVALLVSGELSVGDPKAVWLGLGSALFYSLYILASSRLLKGVPPLVALTYILTFAGIALSALNLRNPERVGSILVGNAANLSLIVGFGSIGAMGLFLAGLQKLRAWEVSLLSTLEPVTGVALAVALLGDRLSVAQSAGAAAVLVAMVMISLPQAAPRPATQETR